MLVAVWALALLGAIVAVSATPARAVAFTFGAPQGIVSPGQEVWIPVTLTLNSTGTWGGGGAANPEAADRYTLDVTVLASGVPLSQALDYQVQTVTPGVTPSPYDLQFVDSTTRFFCRWSGSTTSPFGWTNPPTNTVALVVNGPTTLTIGMIGVRIPASSDGSTYTLAFAPYYNTPGVHAPPDETGFRGDRHVR